MRRIDVLAIGLGVFLFGGGVYMALRVVGVEALNAGLWSQVVLVLGLLGWLVTYLTRVATHKMTYFQQLEDYETAVLQKRLDEMTPEELATLQDELADEPAAATEPMPSEGAPTED
ncbi:DUF3007 family protein [Synechococcales cyanobacterium C]|uniref:DUF3007 family protein n=1 Tax=Petrachloros mirabilis ULC683 TaxID=2781853 RepID=A0A8K1ZXM0_9CYAN|nr:DUF3007 family protein [Petrachloros mirabilis]NCJ05876.1 DUF3007 family protein [Petrachloros mirabilis ULC683]